MLRERRARGLVVLVFAVTVALGGIGVLPQGAVTAQECDVGCTPPPDRPPEICPEDETPKERRQRERAQRQDKRCLAKQARQAARGTTVVCTAP